MKAVLIALVLLCGLVALVAILSVSNDPNSPQAEVRDDCKDHAFGYLVELQKGNSSLAASYWKRGVRSAKLFDVRDFDEISHGFMNQPDGKPYKNSRVYYQYEVQSSTQGGFAIRKRWDIVVERSSQDYNGKSCAIVDLQAAE